MNFDWWLDYDGWSDGYYGGENLRYFEASMGSVNSGADIKLVFLTSNDQQDSGTVNDAYIEVRKRISCNEVEKDVKVFRLGDISFEGLTAFALAILHTVEPRLLDKKAVRKFSANES